LIDFFETGYHVAKRMYYLALLPFLVDSVFLTGRFAQSISTYTFRIGVKFSLPFYFPSLTNVYDFPARPGISTELPVFGLAPIFGSASAILYTVILAYVSAGYLGRLHSSITGTLSTILDSANKYFLRILAYAALWLGLTLVGVIIALANPLSAVLYVLLLIVVNYFLFLTPFAIVADNVSLTEGLRRSLNASGSLSSRTIPYVLLYGLVTIVVSVPVYLILNFGLLSFFAALAGFAFIGTVLVASTFCFYSNIAPQEMKTGSAVAEGQ